MADFFNPEERSYGITFDGKELAGYGIHVLNPNGAPNTPNADWGSAHITYYLEPTNTSHVKYSEVDFKGDLSSGIHFRGDLQGYTFFNNGLSPNQDTCTLPGGPHTHITSTNTGHFAKTYANYGPKPSVNDHVQGGAGDDWLEGLTGNDLLLGNGGDDYIDGGSGNDSLDGGDGNDILIGGEGDDTILGGNGDDIIFGDEGTDILLGGAGDDMIFGGDGDDGLAGGIGNDTLIGGAGNDEYLWNVGDGVDFVAEDVADEGIDRLTVSGTTELYILKIDDHLALGTEIDDLAVVANWYTNAGLELINIGGSNFTSEYIASLATELTSFNALSSGESSPLSTIDRIDFTNIHPDDIEIVGAQANIEPICA